VINAQLLLATRPARSTVGLATFIVEVPAYLWMELLTHKRFARNASSARAQSHKRHKSMGYYQPAQWYFGGDWMTPGAALDAERNAAVAAAVELFYADQLRGIERIQEVAGGRLANEQINRLMSITRMMRGMMTGTEAAWRAMLALRTAPTADAAMRDLAWDIQAQLDAAAWVDADHHVPYAQLSDTTYLAAAARIARISAGKPGPGQRPDEELGEALLRDGHWSPFEHIAQYTDLPRQSALASMEDDIDARGWGWETLRATYERIWTEEHNHDHDNG